MKTVARVAASRASVLIMGETGTGKELVARTIHRFSDRAGNRFVGVNCAALSEGVLESELFGHVRGAFTGAVASRPGVIREADGGTLFLERSATSPRA
jgi:transcriptional regulator with GAF, ATPase, and Fis domain